MCEEVLREMEKLKENLPRDIQLNVIQNSSNFIRDSINNVTTTAASTGVKLPPAETGAQVVVFNNGASTLTVYALTGSTVDAGASASIATGKERIFFGISPTVWLSHLGA